MPKGRSHELMMDLNPRKNGYMEVWTEIHNGTRTQGVEKYEKLRSIILDMSHLVDELIEREKEEAERLTPLRKWMDEIKENDKTRREQLIPSTEEMKEASDRAAEMHRKMQQENESAPKEDKDSLE